MSEEWRTVPSFPDYEASTEGRIRRARADQFWRVGRIVKQAPGPGGYRTLNLFRDGMPHVVLAHRVFAETFHGPCPFPRAQAAHQNGDRTDNRPANLRWMTPGENARQRREHGTELLGEKSNLARLTEADVHAIRRRRHSGELPKTIAPDFGITTRHVWKIATHRVWSHI